MKGYTRMRRLLIPTLILILSSYGAINKQTILSPSEALYYEGNKKYDKGEYAEAIEYFNKFLDSKPNSPLATPASLNLGLAYYGVQNYKDAYSTLKDIRLSDENIKAYVDSVLEICKNALGDDIVDEEKVQSAAIRVGGGEVIQIQVIDAYLDDFDNVNLTGSTDKISVVSANGVEATIVANNQFVVAVRWKKGRSITISAIDENGNTGEIDFYPDGEAPDKPENLRLINASNNSLEFEWDEDYDDEIIGYRIFYRLQGGELREVNELTTRYRHEIVGLDPIATDSNRTFEIFIRALDKMQNESNDSNILEADLL